MKKIISKILIIFIIMVILFEFIYSSNISYAFDSEDINSITNLIGGIVSIILWIPRILTIGMAWITGKIMTESLAESCGINDTVEIFKGTEGKVATPFDIFFNKYKLFDVNFFDITTEDNIINTIRVQVAQWFYIFRTLAAAILLVVLVYVGIRMAISTIAEDKAKYKKMLFDWCSSLALVFVLQYIAIFTIYANNAIVNFLRDYLTQNDGKQTYSQINAAISDIIELGMGGMGIGSIVATFAYCMIVFQTIAFMLTYIQRMLKVGFLLIISPLISITYSIDKMGDGKAQALNSWLKEYVYTILIQPFHCIMYLAFVNTAMKLLGSGATVSDVVNQGFWEAIGNMNQLANGFLAILCLKFINDGEKAIRKIFNFQDDSSMTSMAAGAAIGMAAISNAKKIGKATAKGINTAKGIPTKFGKALGNDKEAFGKLNGMLKESKLGQLAGKVGNKASDIGKKFSESKLGTKAIGAGKFLNGKITNGAKFIGGKASLYKAKADKIREKVSQFKENNPKLMKKINGAKTLGKSALKRSMPIALGMMGAAMSYATGSSGAMEAIGVGSGLSHGSEEYFASSQNTVEETGEEAVNSMIENDEGVKDAKEKLSKNSTDLVKTNESLKETNKTISGMSENQRAMGKHYMDLYKRDQELDQKKAKLDPTNENYESQLAEIEKEKERIAKTQDELREDPEFAKVAKIFDHKHELEQDFAQLAEDRGTLEANLKAAKKEAAGNIIKSYKQNGSDSKIAKAKTEIQKAIQKCQLEKKKKDANGDVNANYELNENEISSSERMQKSICDLVDRAVLASGAEFDTSKFISDNFGNDSAMGQNLYAAISEYQFQKNAQKYNNARSYGEGVGVDGEKYDDDVQRKVSGLNG